MGFFAPEAVWDAFGPGDERLRGPTAIRAMLEDWFPPYEEYEVDSTETRTKHRRAKGTSMSKPGLAGDEHLPDGSRWIAARPPGAYRVRVSRISRCLGSRW